MTLFEAAYREMVSLPSALTAYRRMFTEILDDQRRPALFHCTTGKDRTGWAAAATLTLLGVEPSYLDAAFDEMRNRFGSIEAYFSQGPGIDANDQQSLHASLVK